MMTSREVPSSDLGGGSVIRLPREGRFVLRANNGRVLFGERVLFDAPRDSIRVLFVKDEPAAHEDELVRSEQAIPRRVQIAATTGEAIHRAQRRGERKSESLLRLRELALGDAIAFGNRGKETLGHLAPSLVHSSDVPCTASWMRSSFPMATDFARPS